MKNLSRRDFLRLSGAAVFAVGMTGALSGCDENHSSATMTGKPFGTKIPVENCIVTFLRVRGTQSAEKGGLVQAVELSVENNGAEKLTLKKSNFAVYVNQGKKLEIDSVYPYDDEARTTKNAPLECEAGETLYIYIWLKDQIHVGDYKKLQALVTIGETTVSAVTSEIALGAG